MPDLMRGSVGSPRSANRRVMLALIGLAVIVLPPDARAEDRVIKHFSNGSSRDSVGMIDAREDAPADGPQAIYAADDGSLYLLDQINGRVLRFDAKKADSTVQALELPQDLKPTD